MKKKMLAIPLILLTTILSLSACGKGGKKSSSSESGGSETSEHSESSSSESSGSESSSDTETESGSESETETETETETESESESETESGDPTHEVTNITISKINPYGDYYLSVYYDVYPFKIEGHTFDHLLINGELPSENFLEYEPLEAAKYFNVRVNDNSLSYYQFNWYDTNNELYAKGSYGNQGGGDNPGGGDQPDLPDGNETTGGNTPITINDDETASEIFLNVNDTNCYYGGYFDVFKDVTAYTDTGINLTHRVECFGTVDNSKTGIYTLTYKVTFKNLSVTKERKVTVIADKNPKFNRDIDAKTGESVTIGGGSYKINTDENITHPADPKSVNFNGPIKTNSWFSGFFSSPSTMGLYVDQYKVKLSGNYPNEGQTKDGVVISNIGTGFVETYNTNKHTVTGKEAMTFSMHPNTFSDLIVKPSDYQASDRLYPHVLSYDDYSVKFSMREDGSTIDQEVVTVSQGSPYVLFETFGKRNMNIVMPEAGMGEYRFYTLDGNKFVDGKQVSNGAIVIELFHKHTGFTMNGYALGAPTYSNYYFLVNASGGSTFTPSHYEANNQVALDKLTITQNNGNFMSVAPLGAAVSFEDIKAMANDLNNHAFNIGVHGETSFKVNHDTNEVISTFASNVHHLDNKDNSMVNVLYPHQYKCTNVDVSSYSMSSMRGRLRLYYGNIFKTKLNFYGLLPGFSIFDGADQVTAKAYLSKLLENTTYDGAYDKDVDEKDYLDNPGPYWNSKALYPLGQGLLIAKQIGDDSDASTIITRMKYILEDWFKYEGNNDDRYLYYNNIWNSLYYSNDDFGTASRLTDHHFTHGYIVLASAILFLYDSNFFNSYKDILTLMVKDYANYDRNDLTFPYLRCFDTYSGHSWSDGMADAGDGNNQESAGEALNSWTAMYLFSLASNNTEMMDTAIYGYVTELYSVKQYWFDYDETNWMRDVTVQTGSHCLGMVWGAKNEYQTWFGPNAEFIYGIQWLPTGEYLSGYAIGNEKNTLKKIYESFLIMNGGEPNTWYSNFWVIQALYDPNKALQNFDANKILNDDYPNELLGSYWMINALVALGNKTDTAFVKVGSQVGGSVYLKDGKYTAMIINYSSVTKEVKIVKNGSIITKNVAPGFVTIAL